MPRPVLLLALAVTVAAAGLDRVVGAQVAGRGTIRGHIKLEGRLQGARVEQLLQIRNSDEILHNAHSWMTMWVGIVSHPYFAVSSAAGTFEISNVPAGSYQLVAWHERYGQIARTIRVRSGAIASVEFAYAGDEKPAQR